MRETWLSENQRLVSQDNFGFDLAAVEAAAKKHEAIETDIFAYEERVQAVVAVSQELEAENYHDIDRINARYRERMIPDLRVGLLCSKWTTVIEQGYRILSCPTPPVSAENCVRFNVYHFVGACTFLSCTGRCSTHAEY